jgi:choline dehydrogenase-like flavoprotein
VIGYYDEDDLQSWLGPAGELIHSMEFYETRPDNDFARGAKYVCMPLPGPLNALELQRSLGFEQVWGAAFHDVARSHRNGILWAAITEDLPTESHRVTLDPVLTDSDGIPAPKIEYRIGDNTRKILRFSNERMREIHEAMGATRTIDIELWIDQPGHLLGTARMGTDPGRSVVNPDGRAHDVPNLYIADGSTFVTSGAVNPTSTISALALKVATAICRDAEFASHAASTI